MMADVESLDEIMARWNPAPEDHSLELIVGVPAPAHDGRETDHVDHPLAGHTQDNKVVYDDDGDDDSPEDYSDEEKWTFASLKEEIDSRNADRDDDDQISKGGGREDLVARLVEDDGSEDDE